MGGDVKRVSNWLMNDVMRMLNDSGKTAGEIALTPLYLAEIIKLVDSGTVNTNTANFDTTVLSNNFNNNLGGVKFALFAATSVSDAQPVFGHK